MTVERLKEILTEEENKIEKLERTPGQINRTEPGDNRIPWKGDNVAQAIILLAKYIDPKKEDIIQGRCGDMIFLTDVSKVLNAGLTEEDAKALAWLSVGIDDYTYPTCLTMCIG